ncbi:MAG: hypothetical protein HY875_14845 [Chloroflexi bacterium]|nr:hypothetical protein [Chloroflexota bacterium]
MDSVSNNISLFQALEQVQMVLASPAQDAGNGDRRIAPLQFQLVALWARTNRDEAERGDFRIVIAAENEDTVGVTPPIGVDLTSHPRSRNIVNLTSVPLPDNADSQVFEYRVEEHVGDTWALRGSIPLDVSVTVDQTAAGGEIPTPVVV